MSILHHLLKVRKKIIYKSIFITGKRRFSPQNIRFSKYLFH